ncbi:MULTISPECIES: NAD(P)-dependent oxidoreductase [Caballeronia]|uniref:NAD(P)-dependent oxidoreductase n=1 Tax=Caballeronia TaxID=1827195 RepID=UPI002285DDC1|nr:MULTISPECIES: NAD(P)-dependent oxidoreductase [Caballeronia]MDR5766728.1 NAD(P)-dependent oxidoreductase [Caballeronia sp. LZ028]MDR5788444.1 NAD(P)-dependent oxidoreductase [Caballeronia sp. LP003]MDR5794902.1 NAD(P)-dependent oxidoreductase [Caballeronia sp. LZ008]
MFKLTRQHEERHSMKQRIGMIGVGLMGHGIARNVMKHGYPLTVVEHPGNQPLDELLAGGVKTVANGEALARASDIVILCVTGSPEVEAVLTAPDGVLAGLQPGAIVIDCSTAVPASTQRMAALVKEAGGLFVDAPMTRTAKEAHEGRLNLLVGASAELFARIEPLLRTYAENVTLVGDVGAGHSMKLLHNFVSLGTIALISEAAACAKRAGVDAQTFVDVLAKGGGGGAALERLRPSLIDGDPSGMPFHMSNALKDLGYYVTMAGDNNAVDAIAGAVRATYADAVEQGGAHRTLLELPRLLGD